MSLQSVSLLERVEAKSQLTAVMEAASGLTHFRVVVNHCARLTPHRVQRPRDPEKGQSRSLTLEIPSSRR